MDRRLTTIVAPDIAGFSRLVGLDEEGTLTAQRARRAELADSLIAGSGGRAANSARDSLLIEFAFAQHADRAIGLFQRTARVNRKAPNWIREDHFGSVIMAGRYDDSIPVCLEALKSSKGLATAAAESHLGLAIANDAPGRDSEAREANVAPGAAEARFSVTFLRDYRR